MVLDAGLVDKSQWNYVMDSEGNNRARMYATPTSPFVTAALYGRDHSRDSANIPYAVSGIIVDLNNNSSGLSANINILLIVTMSLFIMSIAYVVNRLPVKNGFKISQTSNYGSV